MKESCKTNMAGEKLEKTLCVFVCEREREGQKIENLERKKRNDWQTSPSPLIILM